MWYRPPADHMPIHIQVEHLHNTGRCKGELIADKRLFSYRSTDRPNDDRDWTLTELKTAESKKQIGPLRWRPA